MIARVGLEQRFSSGLNRVSVEQHSVIELTYYDGRSYQEIAEIMQCPVNTVKTKMFHARADRGSDPGDAVANIKTGRKPGAGC